MNYKELLKEIRSVMNEELFYKPPRKEEEPIPFTDINAVVEEILKYFKKFPEFKDIEGEYVKGKTVLQFTNFGSLSQRDKAIKALVKDGYLTNPLVKRLDKYHRATTPFVFRYKSGKDKKIEIQLNQGGGPAGAGARYEQEIVDFMNEQFKSLGKSYQAFKRGGSSSNPDVEIEVFSLETGEVYVKDTVRMEAKTKAKGTDFGQFKIKHTVGLPFGSQNFKQISQTDSKTMKKIFESILNELNQSCKVPQDAVSEE
ncbi:MAG TPA: hypothetical protein DCM40_28130, partial [Maribacter sp.]|nr:hypothetical protein [Maribacter sp.]